MIKRCVGPVLYFEDKVFLMQSPKWQKWIIPGGKIEDGETPEEALHREITEKLSLEVFDVCFSGRKIKSASADFHKPDVEFHFWDYFARTESMDVVPNEEISNFGWFTLDEAFALDLLDSTRALLQRFAYCR